MSVSSMNTKPRRPNEEPYAGKLLVRFREGLGRQLPGLLNKVLSVLWILTLSLIVSAAGHIKWDVDNDMDVDLEDLGLLNTKLGLTSDSAGWNPVFDMDTNNIIDSLDGADVAGHLHLTNNMALVPSGIFVMGDSALSFGSFTMSDTIRVYVDSFWVDKYEITNLKLITFLNDRNDTSFQCDSIPGNFTEIYLANGTYHVDVDKEDYPARNISWDAAREYCHSLGKRLLSSAEWEKAARGADGRRYTWGNTKPDSSYANINYRCDSAYLAQFPEGERDSICNTALWFFSAKQVGSYSLDISPYGVYDLCGNVTEWVNDFYNIQHIDYWNFSDARNNPIGYSSGTFNSHVSRGASFKTISTETVPATIYGGNNALNDRGFRCAY